MLHLETLCEGASVSHSPSANRTRSAFSMNAMIHQIRTKSTQRPCRRIKHDQRVFKPLRIFSTPRQMSSDTLDQKSFSQPSSFLTMDRSIRNSSRRKRCITYCSLPCPLQTQHQSRTHFQTPLRRQEPSCHDAWESLSSWRVCHRRHHCCSCRRPCASWAWSWSWA